VVAHPTWYDPCSRVVLEALAVGLPAVTTRYNGAAEVMEVGRHGTVIDEPQDVAALAQALRTTLAPEVRAACRELGITEFDFVLGPCWAEPPYYRLSAAQAARAELTAAVEAALRCQNEEYESRVKSGRLGALQWREIPADAIAAMDRRLIAARRGTAEQYKRPSLLTAPGEDDRLLNLGKP